MVSLSRRILKALFQGSQGGVEAPAEGEGSQTQRNVRLRVSPSDCEPALALRFGEQTAKPKPVFRGGTASLSPERSGVTDQKDAVRGQQIKQAALCQAGFRERKILPDLRR